MANQTYRPLFQIGVFHTYFESGTAEKCVTLLPNDATKKLFHSYGCIFQNKGGIYTVYGSYTGEFQDLLNEMEAATGMDSFNFVIKVTDPIFMNYTELPLDAQNTYLYESSNNTESQEGIYLKPKTLAFDTHFGTVRVYFNDITASLPEAPLFTLPFNARATRWDYYIVNARDMNLETLSIETNEDFQFLGPEQVTISNGQTALKFTSGNKLLALWQKPKYKFSIVETLEDGSKKEVIIGLPTPDPNNLDTYNEDGITKASSPVYI